MADMIGIGIDFGTSNSAVACFDGKKVVLIDLENDDSIMPTATHIDRDIQTTTGKEAVELYIDENRDRRVELTPEVVARTSLLVDGGNPDDPYSAPETVSASVYGKPLTDRGMPGRLFRGVKRLLGNADIKRLLVFDHPFRLVALITPVLLRIRKTVESHISESLADVHVGHPVQFEGHSDFRNDLALSRLEEACNYAGISELSFYPEPVAATLSFLFDESHVEAGHVLTLDFGGGTLDLSILAYDKMTFKVLATAGRPLGGDHIDQLIFRHLLFPLLGKGEIWSRTRDGVLIENEFPFEEFEELLLNWAVTYTLNQNYYRSKVNDCITKGGPAAEKFERLLDLITHNYSYLVFQSIRDAKAALSDVPETVLDIPELDIQLNFTREELESMMAPMLVEINEVIDDVIESSGLGADDIDVVIRTGGSSQIMAVRNLLEQRFPGKVTEHDPFTSVAAGLAIASYHGYEFVTPELHR